MAMLAFCLLIAFVAGLLVPAAALARRSNSDGQSLAELREELRGDARTAAWILSVSKVAFFWTLAALLVHQGLLLLFGGQ